jgi:hypothetical protein
MIIQSISLLDTLDKDINTFSMRIKEWYGWHFPELVKIVSDNYKYARCVRKIQVHACTATAEGCAGAVVAVVVVGCWDTAGWRFWSLWSRTCPARDRWSFVRARARALVLMPELRPFSPMFCRGRAR